MSKCKKKLVLISTRFPWPLTNGFANKNYWLVRGLSDTYEIYLHIVQYKKTTDSDLNMVKDYCNTIKIYRPTFFDILTGLLKSLLQNLPFQLALYRSLCAKKSIDADVSNTSIVLCSVIRGVQYLKSYSGPLVCDLADSLGQVYLRDSIKFRGLKRLIYREEGLRMLKYEKAVVRQAGQSLFFNPREASYYANKTVSVVPHGVDPRLLNLDESNSNYADGVVIFGKMNFEPNVNAVEWFIENVLSSLPVHIKLYVVGADPSTRITKLANQNSRVKVTGFLSDPYPSLRGAIANICPIQMGGGIQNKVIEGLAIGALGIVSSLAADPMPEIENSGLIVCDSPDQWVRSILAAYTNREDFESNRNMGRKYARKHFSWEAYIKAVKKSILLVTTNHGN
jgi:glycosyltransferase involved in cell wall biosynthesis